MSYFLHENKKGTKTQAKLSPNEGDFNMTNPKISQYAEKDPKDWVTGDEPMTGPQASYLKTLTEQTHKPEAFDETLTKAEASAEIDRLKEGPQ
jgi:hypothetical protein